MKNSLYKLKTNLKKIALLLGLYKPARYFNDLIYRRKYIASFRQDIEFYRRLLPAGSLCFDVGANMGEKTEALLRAGMKVVAIEPQPLCVSEIKARCAGYENLSICETAVGDKPGTATLYVSDVFHASSSLKSDWGPSSESFEVPVTTVDSIIDDFGLPYYCKIDVEGYELEVIKGMNREISLVSFEYHLSDIDLVKTEQCLEELSSRAKADIEINITPAEDNKFVFDDWLTLSEFNAQFPSTFIGKQEFVYGDIWVRLKN